VGANVRRENARSILCSTESTIEVVQFSTGDELEAYGEERMRPQEINRNIIENMDDIKSQFRYISDRWNCSGRIKFMLEVINRGL